MFNKDSRKKEQDSVDLQVGFGSSCLGAVIQHILAYSYKIASLHKIMEPNRFDLSDCVQNKNVMVNAMVNANY